MSEAIFCIAFFVAYTVQGITGFAGNMFAMPVGIYTLGMGESIAVLNAMGVMACGLLSLLNFKSIDWHELGRIIGVMLPFMLVGIWVDNVVSLGALLRVYGLIIMGVGLYNLVSKRQRFLPSWAQWVVLAAAGLIQGMFISGGALLVIYAVQKIQDKHRFRATLSMVWTVLNLLYAGIAFQGGAFTPVVVNVVLACIPLAALATVLGNWVGKRISKEHFLKIAYAVLALIGALLLFSA